MLDNSHLSGLIRLHVCSPVATGHVPSASWMRWCVPGLLFVLWARSGGPRSGPRWTVPTGWGQQLRLWVWLAAGAPHRGAVLREQAAP